MQVEVVKRSLYVCIAPKVLTMINSYMLSRIDDTTCGRGGFVIGMKLHEGFGHVGSAKHVCFLGGAFRKFRTTRVHRCMIPVRMHDYFDTLSIAFNIADEYLE